MPDLIETSVFTAGVRRLDRTDPVVGQNPALLSDIGAANWAAQDLANRTKWLKDRVDALSLTAGVTVTVGAAGDFTTINAALAFLSLRRPAYVPSGFITQIQLLTGFIMNEQVICTGIDFGWVRITSVDPLVTINRAALTTSVLLRFPAFAGLAGANMPTIGCLFDMNTGGVATNRDGVLVSNASLSVLNNCGIRRAGAHGLNATSGAIVTADTSDFRQATDSCIYAHSSIVNADYSNLTAGDYGCVSARGASVSVLGATITGCITRGLFGTFGGRINADNANARRGGVDSATDIVVNQGSQIVSTSGTGGLNIAANTVTVSGIIFR